MAVTKTDNRTNGGRFEQELSHVLADNGFWVHVLQQNKAGQPADIIAVKGAFSTLIDCKVISDNKGFPFERVEENQKFAMRKFQRCSGEMCYFALKLPDGSIHLVSLERIETMRNRGNMRLSDDYIRNQTWSLEKWLETSDVWGRRRHEHNDSEQDLY